MGILIGQNKQSKQSEGEKKIVADIIERVINDYGYLRHTPIENSDNKYLLELVQDTVEVQPAFEMDKLMKRGV